MKRATPDLSGVDERVYADEPEYECEICRDRGKLVRTDERGVEVASPCSCRLRKTKENRLAVSGVPEKFVGAALADFVTSHPDRGVAQRLLQARTVVGEWIQNYTADTKKGLVLVGSPGAGKSMLAAILAQAIIERTAAKVAFVELSRFVQAVKETYGRDSRETRSDLVTPIVAADVAVIDELGQPDPTDHNLDLTRVMIEGRYRASRPTIFTTNFPFKRNDPTRTVLLERLDGPLVSRVHEMAWEISLEGVWDYREEVLQHART